MFSIKLLFHIKAKEEQVIEAVATVEGVSQWWTVHTGGESGVDGILNIDFPPNHSNKMKVISITANAVIWECIEGAPEWIGTLISFRTDRMDDKTRVRFEHGNWADNGDFYAQCTFGWGHYLGSLKELLETGSGKPFGSS